MTKSNSRRALLRSSALVGSLCFVLMAGQAVAQPNTYSFDIPSEPLAAALHDFARVSGQQIIFTPAQVAGKTASPLQGKYTTDEALARLFAGTDLTVDHSSTAGLMVQSKNAQAASNDGAANQKPFDVETVVVTGSRIPVKSEGPQAVQTFTSKNIEQSGQATVSGFLSTVPSVALSSTESKQLSQGATGVSLRGLPVGTTLVLIDGRRIEDSAAASGVGTEFFDLNNLPVAAVDRIEIVGSGSSAIYGSDAIGGVVNIILKKGFDGFDVSARYGAADGTNETNISAAFGKKWENAQFSVVGSFLTRSALAASDRALTATNNYTPYGGPNTNSSTCNPGNVFSLTGQPLPGAPAGSNATYAGVSATPTSGKPALSSFSYSTLNQCPLLSGAKDLPQTQRMGLFSQGSVDISSSVQLFAELLVSNEQQYFIQGGNLLFGVQGLQLFTVGASNPYNPFGTAVGIAESLPSSINRSDINTTFFRPLIGLRGTAFGDWRWELTAFQSADWTKDTLINYIANSAGIKSALNSSDPSVALNPFVAGSPGANIQSFYTNGLRQYTGSNSTIQGYVTGSIFTLPAGPLSIAAGGEYDRSALHIDYANDPAFPANTFQAHYRETYAAFGELRVPVLGDPQQAPGNETLVATLADRFDQYSDFGSRQSPQFGVEWRPAETLLIRGTYAEAFKAPGLLDLYSPVTSSTALFQDPTTGTNVVAASLTGGNSHLRPLTGDSRTVGAVYSSQFIPNLRLSITNWEISERNVIESVQRAFILNNAAQFPGRVVRSASGSLISVDDTLINLGSIDVSGLDYQANYTYGSDIGEWSPSVSVSQTYKYSEALAAGSPAINAVSKAQATNAWAPRWKGTAALGWGNGPYSASVDGRYVGSYQDYGSTRTIGDFWLFDANIHYNIGSDLAADVPVLNGASISIGGVNIFNELPQFSNYQSGGVGYDPAQGDIRGRFLYVQLEIKQ